MSSCSGGGGDLLDLICPELGVTPLVDPGTDVEDELPTPAASPVPAVHGVEHPVYTSGCRCGTLSGVSGCRYLAGNGDPRW